MASTGPSPASSNEAGSSGSGRAIRQAAPDVARVLPIALGLRANAGQFALLVGVQTLIGAMVGQERTVLPLMATRIFGLEGVASVLTFLVAFGITKALTNLAAGLLADRFGRHPVLVAGWLIGVPVPVLLIWAPSWEWVVAANVLLGINQGLTWSVAVMMKVDLVGPRRGGLALGLNEAAGYSSVALTALVTGFIAGRAGLRPPPFVLRPVVAVAGTSQLATGALSDRIGRKGLIVGGLLLQGAAIAAIAGTSGFLPWFLASIALGIGTGMVYPTLLAAVADVADPAWRGSALGVYRMWRDLRFAARAILVGVVADRAGMTTAIAAGAASN